MAGPESPRFTRTVSHVPQRTPRPRPQTPSALATPLFLRYEMTWTGHRLFLFQRFVSPSSTSPPPPSQLITASLVTFLA